MMMILNFASRAALRLTTTRVASPAMASCRWLTITDTFSKKERVEEDRFMREQEKKFFEQKKQELTQQKDVDEFQNKIAPAMAEAMAVLKDAGDTTVVSDKGLEALARWKLGL